MASDLSEEGDVAEKAAESNESAGKALLIALAVLTVVAAAGGWFLGTSGLVAPGHVAPQQPEQGEKGNGKLEPDRITAHSNVMLLEPIVTNLASPANAWVRMETALVARQGVKIPVEMAAEISNDFLACLRQHSLVSLKGAAGLMYLREDLLERARVRSHGKISYVLISNLVFEE